VRFTVTPENVCRCSTAPGIRSERCRPEVRTVEIGRFRYFTQDREEEEPAGHRASRGAQIVWVERIDTSGRAVARIEDGRVFRGHARCSIGACAS